MSDFPLRLRGPVRYIQDCRRIKAVLESRGYDVDLWTCQQLWEERSERASAGWLYLPEYEDALWDALRPYFVDWDDEE